MENCRKREEVEEVDDDKEANAKNQQQQQSYRSTGVHQRAQAVAVNLPVDRPIDRLTLPNSRLGTVDRHGRPVLGSVDRPSVDR